MTTQSAKYDPVWVAEELGVSVSMARRMMASGRIRSFCISDGLRRYWRTLPEDVEEYKRTFGKRSASARLSYQTQAKPETTRQRKPIIVTELHRHRRKSR